MPDLDVRFTALIAAHGDVPWRIARAYTATPADRDDLYQDMLLQAWRALPAFRGDASERTWLTRIALNVALGAARRRRPAHNARTEALPDSAPSPSEQAATADATERLYAAIRTLPDADRALVLLSLDERSHAEIADVLGIRTGTVAVRLHRARARLATLLTGR